MPKQSQISQFSFGHWRDAVFVNLKNHHSNPNQANADMYTMGAD